MEVLHTEWMSEDHLLVNLHQKPRSFPGCSSIFAVCATVLCVLAIPALVQASQVSLHTLGQATQNLPVQVVPLHAMPGNQMRYAPSSAAVHKQFGQSDRLASKRLPMGLSLAPGDLLNKETWDASANVPAALGVSSTLFGIGILSGKFERVLTPLLPNPLLSGITHSWLLSVILWATLGWQGWSVCVLYLFLGVAVTKVRSKEKEAAGIAEGRGGARGPENVWGSAATAAVCALLSVSLPQQAPLLALGFVASLATKLSDTCGSEIGKAFGKTPILITTLQQVPPGTEGAVSVEGTVAGIIGSALLALFAVAVGLISLQGVGLVMVAAFIACNFESFLGATIQGKVKWMTNEVVNAINTTVGAAVAMAGATALAVFGFVI